MLLQFYGINKHKCEVVCSCMVSYQLECVTHGVINWSLFVEAGKKRKLFCLLWMYTQLVWRSYPQQIQNSVQIETSSSCSENLAVGYQIVVVTNILMKLLLPYSNSEHQWPVFSFSVGKGGGHLRCHSWKLKKKIYFDTVFCVHLVWIVIHNTSKCTFNKYKYTLQLPEVPKCYLQLNLTHVEYYVSWNFLKFNSINLLKPTGHVMHQRFNIQQLYVLPTMYLCVLYLSKNKQRLVPLTA